MAQITQNAARTIGSAVSVSAPRTVASSGAAFAPTERAQDGLRRQLRRAIFASPRRGEEDLMPLRGSVQLLLLFFRTNATRRHLVAAALFGALLVSSLTAGLAIWGKGTVGGIMIDGAWKRAIANEPVSALLPWSTASENEQTVTRLGLSAVALDEFDSTAGFTPDLATFNRKASQAEPAIITARGHRAQDFGDVAIGDHITIVAPDGQTLIYRVTATRMVETEQAKRIKPSLGPAISLVTRPPSGGLADTDSRLVIEAIAVELPAPVPETAEQKL